ncbi:MAG: Uroporphyrinogen synthase [Gammaproteobacteria bacterium]|nr:Uroporphyrinogen synthase [Gammaproteobacteria bacterium]
MNTVSGTEAAAGESRPADRERSPAGHVPKHVVVTRSESRDGPLSSELRNLGLPVLLWPAVTVETTETGPLEAALADITSFQWIVFASRHAVAAVTGLMAIHPASVRIAAVGQATAQVLRQRGWPVDLLPSEANAAALVDAFAATAAIDGARILFPASSRALPTIAAGLKQLGAEVTQVEAYRTESSGALDVETCRSWIARGSIGAVTFASPSAVDELEHALGKDDFDRLLSAAAAVAIGPTTAKALTERGHTPALAESATLQGLAHTTHRLLQTRQDLADGER